MEVKHDAGPAPKKFCVEAS
jgi:cyclin-dependent kinase 2